MATYEYLCLVCERHFEERRPMGSSIDTALACPSCGSDRVRRRFSFVVGGGSPVDLGGGRCGCGGSCACAG